VGIAFFNCSESEPGVFGGRFFCGQNPEFVGLAPSQQIEAAARRRSHLSVREETKMRGFGNLRTQFAMLNLAAARGLAAAREKLSWPKIGTKKKKAPEPGSNTCSGPVLFRLGGGGGNGGSFIDRLIFAEEKEN